MAIKVAMVGAGSIGFTRKLVHDMLAVPELRDTIFAFTDISQRNLDMVTQLCQRDIRANHLPARISATTDRRTAIAESDYVISTICQGRCGCGSISHLVIGVLPGQKRCLKAASEAVKEYSLNVPTNLDHQKGDRTQMRALAPMVSKRIRIDWKRALEAKCRRPFLYHSVLIFCRQHGLVKGVCGTLDGDGPSKV